MYVGGFSFHIYILLLLLEKDLHSFTVTFAKSSLMGYMHCNFSTLDLFLGRWMDNKWKLVDIF